MILTTICLSALSYFSVYPEEAQSTIDFFNNHPEVYSELRKTLSSEDSRMAMSIVAPELSQYSVYSDKAETGMLKVFYVTRSISNFSIGMFQMKPEFVEKLEAEVARDTVLQHLFPDLPITGDTDRAIRNKRICRLASLEWHVKYLTVFMLLANRITANVHFANEEERLLYLATLYNGGLHLTPDNVEKLKKTKGFPHFSKRFNYAEVCLEFYHKIVLE